MCSLHKFTIGSPITIKCNEVIFIIHNRRRDDGEPCVIIGKLLITICINALQTLHRIGESLRSIEVHRFSIIQFIGYGTSVGISYLRCAEVTRHQTYEVPIQFISLAGGHIGSKANTDNLFFLNHGQMVILQYIDSYGQTVIENDCIACTDLVNCKPYGGIAAVPAVIRSTIRSGIFGAVVTGYIGCRHFIGTLCYSPCSIGTLSACVDRICGVLIVKLQTEAFC